MSRIFCNEVRGADPIYTKEEFKRKALVALAQEKNTPIDILKKVKMGEVIERKEPIFYYRADMDISYIAKVGYDTVSDNEIIGAHRWCMEDDSWLDRIDPNDIFEENELYELDQEVEVKGEIYKGMQKSCAKIAYNELQILDDEDEVEIKKWSYSIEGEELFCLLLTYYEVACVYEGQEFTIGAFPYNGEPGDTKDFIMVGCSGSWDSVPRFKVPDNVRSNNVGKRAAEKAHKRVIGLTVLSRLGWGGALLTFVPAAIFLFIDPIIWLVFLSFGLKVFATLIQLYRHVSFRKAYGEEYNMLENAEANYRNAIYKKKLEEAKAFFNGREYAQLTANEIWAFPKQIPLREDMSSPSNEEFGSDKFEPDFAWIPYLAYAILIFILFGLLQ